LAKAPAKRGKAPVAPGEAREVEAGEIEAGDAEDNVSFGCLLNNIGFHLRLAQEASFKAFAQRVGDKDLKPRRYAILTLIAENPGITQTLLSRSSGRDKSTLTPALSDLEKRGLIRRRKVHNDRRSSTLHLTGDGIALLDELKRHAAEHDRDLDQIVGASRKDDFITLLRRIAMTLDPSDR
jgi:DNA-binding MarR family transcriptional regulator